jgi:predicted SnoaL-like aldol condensation-catalyzing enzyme
MSPATTPTTGSTQRASERGAARARKDAAVAFLREAAAGRARDAFARYATRGVRHHNVYFPADAEALAAGMEQNAAENPQKSLEVKHVLADGDLVAVHSWVRMKPSDPGYALTHIFRFEGDRFAELWDMAQEIPADSPNGNGAF